ncbi:MAG: hypothetical protein ACQEXJ_22800 [Myxococcota bacterium]
MHRHPSDTRSAWEKKREERTREEQLAAQPVTLEELMAEAGSELFGLADAEDLAEFTDAHRERLSSRQFARYVELIVEEYGAPMARRAGLPIGPPRLRLAS